MSYIGQFAGFQYAPRPPQRNEALVRGIASAGQSIGAGITKASDRWEEKQEAAALLAALTQAEKSGGQEAPQYQPEGTSLSRLFGGAKDTSPTVAEVGAQHKALKGMAQTLEGLLEQQGAGKSRVLAGLKDQDISKLSAGKIKGTLKAYVMEMDQQDKLARLALAERAQRATEQHYQDLGMLYEGQAAQMNAGMQERQEQKTAQEGFWRDYGRMTGQAGTTGVMRPDVMERIASPESRVLEAAAKNPGAFPMTSIDDVLRATARKQGSSLAPGQVMKVGELGSYVGGPDGKVEWVPNKTVEGWGLKPNERLTSEDRTGLPTSPSSIQWIKTPVPYDPARYSYEQPVYDTGPSKGEPIEGKVAVVDKKTGELKGFYSLTEEDPYKAAIVKLLEGSMGGKVQGSGGGVQGSGGSKVRKYDPVTKKLVK